MDYKKFLLRYWTTLLIGLCCLVVIIVSMYNSYNSKRNQHTLYDTQLQNERETLRDSIESANNKKLMLFQDSILKAEQVKATASKKEVSKWKTRANAYAADNKKLQQVVDSTMAQYGDSLDTNCLQVVDAYQNQVQGLKKENTALDSTIQKQEQVIIHDSIALDACVKKTVLQDTIIDSKENLIADKDRINEKLSFQLSRQNNWLNRNKTWITFSVGVLLGGLVMK